jgi:hypothetical protein
LCDRTRTREWRRRGDRKLASTYLKAKRDNLTKYERRAGRC